MFNCQKYTEISDFIAKIGIKTKIVSISKNYPAEDVLSALACGVHIFGENRVQEAKNKFEKITNKNESIEVHLTGPLQTNKVKQALDIFDVFHTLDREKLLKEFSKFPEKTSTKSFFIQVNTGKEDSKSGVYPDKVEPFFDLCKTFGLKNIRGLMCIPPINENPKKHFKILFDIKEKLGLEDLSIGMSGDYLEALEFNPTYIRLGTILFGKK
jgi:PLP dependent protein